MKLAFTVHGKPQPQGSLKAFVPKGWNRAFLTSDNTNLKPWRQDVAAGAIEAMTTEGLESPSSDPIEITAQFYFARPGSLPKRVAHKITKPDVDKLLRSVFDSLTSIVFVDDAQIVCAVATKRFGLPERVEIYVRSIAAKPELQRFPGEDPESQCACPDCRRAREVEA